MSDESAQLSLLLPDQPLTPNENKEFVRALARQMLPMVLVRVHERIMSKESTVEESRKFAADLVRITGVEEEKKADPYANLPTINFIFGRRGEISAELVSEVPEPADPPELAMIEDAVVAEIEAARRKTLTLPIKESPDVIPDEASPLPTQDPAVAPLPEGAPLQPRPQEPEDGPPGPPAPARELAEPVSPAPARSREFDVVEGLSDLDSLLGL